MPFGANQFPLVIPVSAVDKFTAPLGRIGGALEGFGTKAQRIGRKVTVGLSAPLAAFGFLSVRTGLEFQKALNRVQVVTGATAEEVAGLQERVEGALGEKGIPTTARSSAAAMLELAHSGQSLAEVERTLPGVIALATSASEDQATAAKITTDVLDAYGLSADHAAEVTDLLALASARGEQELSPLSEGIIEASRAARAFDQDLPGTIAVLDRLADMGKGGAAGAQVFGQALARLRRPSTEGLRALRRLGIEAQDLSKRGADGAVKMRPLEDILETLRARGMDAGDALAIFGPKLGATALGLVRTSGRAREFAGELRDAGGAADRLAKVQLGGGVGTLEEFNQKWERLLVTVARSGLIEGLGEIATQAGKVFTWFQHLSPTTQRWAVRIGAIAAVAGPTLVVVGQLASGVGALASAFGALGAAGLGKGLVGILGKAAPWAALAVAIGSITSDVLDLLDAIAGRNSEPAGGPKVERAADTPEGLAAAFASGRAVRPGASAPAIPATGGAGARADVSGRVQVEFTNTPPGTKIRARQTGDVPIDLEAGYVLAAGLSG